jgi:hypothetical protein
MSLKKVKDYSVLDAPTFWHEKEAKKLGEKAVLILFKLCTFEKLTPEGFGISPNGYMLPNLAVLVWSSKH